MFTANGSILAVMAVNLGVMAVNLAVMAVILTPLWTTFPKIPVHYYKQFVRNARYDRLVGSDCEG